MRGARKGFGSADGKASLAMGLPLLSIPFLPPFTPPLFLAPFLGLIFSVVMAMEVAGLQKKAIAWSAPLVNLAWLILYALLCLQFATLFAD